MLNFFMYKIPCYEVRPEQFLQYTYSFSYDYDYGLYSYIHIKIKNNQQKTHHQHGVYLIISILDLILI